MTGTLDGSVDTARPWEIDGIEVYVGLQVPPEYSRVGSCGVVRPGARTTRSRTCTRAAKPLVS